MELMEYFGLQICVEIKILRFFTTQEFVFFFPITLLCVRNKNPYTSSSKHSILAYNLL